MTDGQVFFMIFGAETAIILAGWTLYRYIRIHRARTEWIRQVEARRQRQDNRPRRPAA